MEEAQLCRKDWRKLVKKLRRKRIRQKLATTRSHQAVSSPESENPEIDGDTLEKHRQWIKKDHEAHLRWLEQERQKKEKENEKKKVQEKIRAEWQAAQAKKAEKQKLQEAKEAELNSKISAFIEDGGDIPEELLIRHESNPGKEMCPFYSKVAACRYGLSCSRNHVVPSISKIILIPGFYSHFTLNQGRGNEYDTDVNLEFEESEMFRDFREFFYDVVDELEGYGEVVVVQVCRNREAHLRGNLYVEYRNERDALRAARTLNARWYGGRQLTVQWAHIASWGSAVCGDFRRDRCHKGSDCNFLHTFNNPRNLYTPNERDRESYKHCSSRSWRWSESPEPNRSRRERSSERRSRRHYRSRSRDTDSGRRSKTDDRRKNSHRRRRSCNSRSP